MNQQDEYIRALSVLTFNQKNNKSKHMSKTFQTAFTSEGVEKPWRPSH